MTSQKAREVVARVLPQLETPVRFDPKEFKHLRRRRADSMQGSCYYGGHYFDPHTAAAGSPEMHLCQSAITGTIRHGNDCFTVWLVGLGSLKVILQRPANGSVVDWSFYSFIMLDDDGTALVFPANRGPFGAELARLEGTHSVQSCHALKVGRLQNPYDR